MLAKSEEALNSLNEQFKRQQIIKEVSVVVHNFSISENTPILDQSRCDSILANFNSIKPSWSSPPPRIFAMDIVSHFPIWRNPSWKECYQAIGLHSRTPPTRRFLTLLRISLFCASITHVKTILKSFGFPVVGTSSHCMSLTDVSRGSKHSQGSTPSAMLSCSKISFKSNCNETGSPAPVEVAVDMPQLFRRVCKREETYYREMIASRESVLKSSLKAASLSSEELNIAVRDVSLDLNLFIGRFNYFRDVVLELDPEVFTPTESSICLVKTLETLISENTTLSSDSILTVLDIGCGSGNLALSIAAFLKQQFQGKRSIFKVIGLDIDEKAIQLCRTNALLNNLEECTSFAVADIFEASINFSSGDDFDYIVCNPPYLSPFIVKAYSRVRSAPKAAVDGGHGGIEFYERLADLFHVGCDAQRQRNCKKRAPKLIIELPGNNHKVAARVRKYFENRKLHFIGFGAKDNHGMNRCAIFQL